MAVFNLAFLDQWSERQIEKMDAIAKGAIQDTGELMSRRQASIKETGTYQEGFVPVDTGELISSQEVRIDGAAIAQGPVDYGAALAGMEIGDTVEAVFTAEHARPIEYGVTGKFPGRFYVRNAVQQWQAIVDANAALFKD